MPEELFQVSPKSHYVSLALHSDPSPLGFLGWSVGCPTLHLFLDWASKTRFGDFCSLKIRVLMKSTAATFGVQDNYWIKSFTKASNSDGCQSQHLFLDCDQSRIIFCLLTPVGPSCSKSARTFFKIIYFLSASFVFHNNQQWVPYLENQTLTYEQIYL